MIKVKKKENKNIQKNNDVKNYKKQIIVVLITVILVILTIVGVVCFQNLRKENLLNGYIEKCSSFFIDGKQSCECMAYHLKYILGEKEVYNYFDMYITDSKEREAYEQTKDIYSKLEKYCKHKTSLVDIFVSRVAKAMKTGISAKYASCVLYHTLDTLGKEVATQFWDLGINLLEITPEEYVKYNVIYKLDQLIAKWDTCTDDFSLVSVTTSKKEVKELIENIDLYHRKVSDQNKKEL